MTWTNGGEGSKIPASVKRLVRQRDAGQCQLGYPGCAGDGSEFDHITNVAVSGMARRDLNHPDLLQLVCTPCHAIKTQREAAAGRVRWRRQPERHPGLRHD